MEGEIFSKLNISITDFRLIMGSSRIEYDEAKEEINREKHSYSLESAVYFLECALLPVPTPCLITSEGKFINGEIRHQHMCKDDDGKVVFFVTTMRPNESIRVISLRQAHENEAEIYNKLCRL